MSEKFSGTRPMSPQHAVDVGRLAAYLRAHVDGFSGELAVSQFKGGQSNPTFLLEAGGAGPLAEQAWRQVEKIVAGKL